MYDVILKIAEQVTETHEKFIFETIKPYCETVVNMEISKEELTCALIWWKNRDEIRNEILEEMASHSGTGEEVTQDYVDGLIRALEIHDKYRSKGGCNDYQG